MTNSIKTLATEFVPTGSAEDGKTPGLYVGLTYTNYGEGARYYEIACYPATCVVGYGSCRVYSTILYKYETARYYRLDVNRANKKDAARMRVAFDKVVHCLTEWRVNERDYLKLVPKVRDRVSKAVMLRAR